jgi:RNA polymerase sigma-70 factor, ECF subfamily
MRLAREVDGTAKFDRNSLRNQLSVTGHSPIAMTSSVQADAVGLGPTDRALASGVLAGDDAAFRVLYRRHTPRLRRVVARVLGPHDADTDDTVQESWVRAVRKLAQFRGESSLSTWLCSIGVRVSRETLRRRRRWRWQAFGSGDPDQRPARPVRDADRIDLEVAIGELPEQARAVVVLHDVEGFTHAEIARHFGTATGTSKSQLSRAHAALRRRLGGSIA